MRRRTATFGKQTPPQNVLRGATPTQDEDAAEAINDSTTFLARAATGPSYNLTTCPRLKLLTLLLALFVLGALYRSDSGQMAIMRLVRDVGRYLARKRLANSPHGLIPLLLGRDEPVFEVDVDDQENAMTFTPDELAGYRGDGDSPIYLSILGRIYDVSSGKAFYGKGRSYHHYTGRDATRSFATGCSRPECLIPSLTGLSDFQKMEAMRWAEFYHNHDKYRFVGVLRVDPVEEAVAKALEMEDAIKESTASRLIEHGNEAYLDGAFSDAHTFWVAALVKIGEADRSNSMAIVEQRATVLMQMAGAAHKQGEIKQAVDYGQEALDSLFQALGDDLSAKHPLVGRALTDRAVLAFLEGDYDGAIELGTEADKVYRTVLRGTDSLSQLDAAGGRSSVVAEAANTRYNLAAFQEHSGRFLEAAKTVQDLLDEFEGEEVPPKVQVIRTRAQKLLLQIHSVHGREHDRVHDGGALDGLY